MASVDAERFDLRHIASRPWKNGAGLTREIARSIGDIDADPSFGWRISVAEVERDGPFSAFPSVDRCIVLLRGSGMRLRARDGSFDHALTSPLEPFLFSGDSDVEATLAGGVSSDFNVMTRRGAFRSEVTCHRQAEAIDCDAAEIALLLCASGEWQVDGEGPDWSRERLSPMQGLVWRKAPRSISMKPFGASNRAAMLLVRLWHDHIA